MNNKLYNLNLMNHRYNVYHSWTSAAGTYEDEPCKKKGIEKTQEYVARLLRRHGEPDTVLNDVMKSLTQKRLSNKDWKFYKKDKGFNYEIVVKEIRREGKGA